MQEINSLRASADQMTMVRALQGELARLRITQANPGAGLGGVPRSWLLRATELVKYSLQLK
jgi:hypothetical protein